MYTGEESKTYVVRRNGKEHSLPHGRFWEIVKARGLYSTDLVYSASGEFKPAVAFPVLRPHLRYPPISPMVKAALYLTGAGLTLYALTKLVEKPSSVRNRPINDEPVSDWEREYVSVRDNWRCVYCGVRVTRATRHIDHSVSRVNGGTNHLNNLRLSCRRCNLSKGPLNSRQFFSS